MAWEPTALFVTRTKPYEGLWSLGQKMAEWNKEKTTTVWHIFGIETYTSFIIDMQVVMMTTGIKTKAAYARKQAPLLTTPHYSGTLCYFVLWENSLNCSCI